MILPRYTQWILSLVYPSIQDTCRSKIHVDRIGFNSTSTKLICMSITYHIISDIDCLSSIDILDYLLWYYIYYNHNVFYRIHIFSLSHVVSTLVYNILISIFSAIVNFYHVHYFISYQVWPLSYLHTPRC